MGTAGTTLAGTGLAAVALLAAAGPARADADAPRVEVTAQLSAVRLVTSACPEGGRAALLPAGRTAFDEGYVLDLTASGRERTGSWLALGDGRYSVAVRCADGTELTGGPVRVPGPASPPATEPSSAPSSAAPPAPPETSAPVAPPSLSASASTRAAEPSEGWPGRARRPYGDASAPGDGRSPAGSSSPSAGVTVPKGGVEAGLGGSVAQGSSPAFDAGVALLATGSASAAVWLVRRRLARRR
ncbi:serine/threonine protein kinase [Streptomyces sp. NPDC049954]|uniref:serine/threonine protein kinase n=1 Tax=Streptomyces sp. NPDC049954 TaxID=3155779 RepID=UPI003429B53E